MEIFQLPSQRERATVVGSAPARPMMKRRAARSDIIKLVVIFGDPLEQTTASECLEAPTERTLIYHKSVDTPSANHKVKHNELEKGRLMTIMAISDKRGRTRRRRVRSKHGEREGRTLLSTKRFLSHQRLDSYYHSRDDTKLHLSVIPSKFNEQVN